MGFFVVVVKCVPRSELRRSLLGEINTLSLGGVSASRAYPSDLCKEREIVPRPLSHKSHRRLRKLDLRDAGDLESSGSEHDAG